MAFNAPLVQLHHDLGQRKEQPGQREPRTLGLGSELQGLLLREALSRVISSMENEHSVDFIQKEKSNIS